MSQVNMRLMNVFVWLYAMNYAQLCYNELCDFKRTATYTEELPNDTLGTSILFGGCPFYLRFGHIDVIKVFCKSCMQADNRALSAEHSYVFST